MNLNLRKYQILLLSLASGLLLAASWPERGFTVLIFVAWVPFLVLEDYILKNKTFFSRGAVVLYSYPGFLLWNVLTTWWVINSSLAGALMAFILNALFMALVFGLFHLIRKKIFPKKTGWMALMAVWFSYEYLHMNWDLTWSWLNLGNVFATHPRWVQWYEFTGVFGGDFWIIAVNILGFVLLKKIVNKEIQRRGIILKSFGILLAVIIPMAISYYIYYAYKEKGDFAQVVVVQPDIDPYNEEFSTPAQELLNNMLAIARQKTDASTDMVFFPETSIPHNLWESDFPMTFVYDSIRNFQGNYDNPPAVVMGLSTRKLFLPGQRKDVAAKEMSSGNYYASYNTAGFIMPDGEINFYHKAKLVPGVERMPFPNLLKPLEKLTIDMGGTSGSLGTSEHRKIFSWNKIKAGTIICYESIYGEFVTGYVREGANLLAIITNDGWWGNTPGYRQHFAYARLRAIETRRDVARAANTGISGFINQRGDVFQATKYWQPAVQKREVRLNTKLTFYVKYGDYLARFSLLISALFILIAISLMLRGKVKSNS